MNCYFDEILRTIVVIDPLTREPEQIGPEIQKWIALGYDVEIPNLPTNRPEYALQWRSIPK